MDKPELEEDDFKHWTYAWQPGDVSLSYCITGKQLIDIWRDDDNIVGEENIKPLDVYSPSFEIYFRPGSFNYPEIEQKFYDWWDENEKKLSRL